MGRSLRSWAGVVGFGVLGLSVGASTMQLASKPADVWSASMERPERIAGLKIDYIIQSLKLKPGDVVADIGSGPGVLSLPLAKAVAPGGKVYSVNLDQGFLDRIDKKAKDQAVTNIRPVLGAPVDPRIPAKDVDVALFHDVLHHIEDRAGYLKATVQYLKPSGRVAIIDLPPDGSHKDDPTLVVTKAQVASWLASVGFHPVEEFTGLNERKWFIVYARQ